MFIRLFWQHQWPPRTVVSIGRNQKKNTFTYDFCSIERVQSGGRRTQDLGNHTPMALPEYLEYYTSKAPSYNRSLDTFQKRESGNMAWLPVSLLRRESDVRTFPCFRIGCSEGKEKMGRRFCIKGCPKGSNPIACYWTNGVLSCKRVFHWLTDDGSRVYEIMKYDVWSNEVNTS